MLGEGRASGVGWLLSLISSLTTGGGVPLPWARNDSRAFGFGLVWRVGNRGRLGDEAFGRAVVSRGRFSTLPVLKKPSIPC